MNYTDAKQKGVILKEEKGCELIRVDDGAKHHFFMHSPKTGDHNLTKLDSLFDDRVKAHWKGFLSNQ